MAGVLATAGVATALSLGTANADEVQLQTLADGDEPRPTPTPRVPEPTPVPASPVHVNFANTRISSIDVSMLNPDGVVVRTCVTRDPAAGNQDTGLKANSVTIIAYPTADCSGEGLHAETVNMGPVAELWVILLETLDDDDTEPWTQ